MGSRAGAAAAVSASSIIIREARAQDEAGCIAIERASFGDPWSDESFTRLVTVQREHIRIAEVQGTVVGYWVGSRIDDEAELANLAVDPARRRSGVGGQLLDHFLKHVGAHQRTTVFLEVRASNVGAQELYMRRGFEPLHRRKGYYSHPTEDAVVMVRVPRAV